MDSQNKQAAAAIHTATAGVLAGAVGLLSPIPGPDAALIAPIQAILVLRLASVYGVRPSSAALKSAGYAALGQVLGKGSAPSADGVRTGARVHRPGRRGGDYEVGKSKTIGVEVRELWHAFSDAGRRELWMPGAEFTVSTATEPRSMRTHFADGTKLDVRFTAKGDRNGTVSVQVRKLPNKEAADEARALWGERLEALKDLLMDPTP